MIYEPVIGLEIHAELRTKTKMFCFTPNDPDEKHPNINICPVCMGHPGTLPVINEEAVRHVRRVGLSLGGGVSEFSQFDRKNYFYPDLPKGYQISQYKHPLVAGGHLDIGDYADDVAEKIKNQNAKIKNTNQNSKPTKRIRITRVHLEEDTARLIHDKEGASLVDFNRAGVPLMELVTEPDFRSSREIIEFGEELRRILRYLEASDANMEKGEMRVEVNISLREIADKHGHQRGSAQINRQESALLGTKVEIKNINSFKFAADAAEYEMKRQAAVLDRGEKVVQETRGWDESKGATFSQRKKEAAHDYRYFPEPDLPPLRISGDEIEELRRHIPELAAAKRSRFVKEFGIDEAASRILTEEKEYADYFEAVLSELLQHDKEIPRSPKATGTPATNGLGAPERPRKDLAKTAASFMTGEFLRLLREMSAPISDVRVTPENFSELVLYFAEDKISNLSAKEVLKEMLSGGGDPSDIIEAKGRWQKSDAGDLEDIARHIVKENPKAAGDFRAGKAASLQFLVGQMMKESRGSANPKMAGEILKKLLGN